MQGWLVSCCLPMLFNSGILQCGHVRPDAADLALQFVVLLFALRFVSVLCLSSFHHSLILCLPVHTMSFSFVRHLVSSLIAVAECNYPVICTTLRVQSLPQPLVYSLLFSLTSFSDPPFLVILCPLQLRKPMADLVICAQSYDMKTKWGQRKCQKKFCRACLKRCYNEEVTDDQLCSWMCVCCRDICTCAVCRRRKTSALLGEASRSLVAAKHGRSSKAHAGDAHATGDGAATGIRPRKHSGADSKEGADTGAVKAEAVIVKTEPPHIKPKPVPIRVATPTHTPQPTPKLAPKPAPSPLALAKPAASPLAAQHHAAQIATRGTPSPSTTPEPVSATLTAAHTPSPAHAPPTAVAAVASTVATTTTTTIIPVSGQAVSMTPTNSNNQKGENNSNNPVEPQSASVCSARPSSSPSPSESQASKSATPDLQPSPGSSDSGSATPSDNHAEKSHQVNSILGGLQLTEGSQLNAGNNGQSDNAQYLESLARTLAAHAPNGAANSDKVTAAMKASLAYFTELMRGEASPKPPAS